MKSKDREIEQERRKLQKCVKKYEETGLILLSPALFAIIYLILFSLTW